MTITVKELLNEAAVTDPLALKVKELAKKHYGDNIYSSAIIGKNKEPAHRLSFRINRVVDGHYRYTKVSDSDKAKIEAHHEKFREVLKKNDIDPAHVKLTHHVGSGVYASIQTKLNTGAKVADLEPKVSTKEKDENSKKESHDFLMNHLKSLKKADGSIKTSHNYSTLRNVRNHLKNLNLY